MPKYPIFYGVDECSRCGEYQCETEVVIKGVSHFERDCQPETITTMEELNEK